MKLQYRQNIWNNTAHKKIPFVDGMRVVIDNFLRERALMRHMYQTRNDEDHKKIVREWRRSW